MGRELPGIKYLLCCLIYAALAKDKNAPASLCYRTSNFTIERLKPIFKYLAHCPVRCLYWSDMGLANITSLLLSMWSFGGLAYCCPFIHMIGEVVNGDRLLAPIRILFHCPLKTERADNVESRQEVLYCNS